ARSCRRADASSRPWPEASPPGLPRKGRPTETGDASFLRTRLGGALGEAFFRLLAQQARSRGDRLGSILALELAGLRKALEASQRIGKLVGGLRAVPVHVAALLVEIAHEEDLALVPDPKRGVGAVLQGAGERLVRVGRVDDQN